MALISDILRGPYGDPQSDVIITMRAMGTSARVLVSNQSAAITDSDGKYSMEVFPGEYEVMVSTLGKIGKIRVYPDSKDGTLNDFLTAPGEEELTPAIVQTVDIMRQEAAGSAAKAKVSEQNSESAMKDALSKTAVENQTVASTVSFTKTVTLAGGEIVMKAVENNQPVIMRLLDTAGVERGAVYSSPTTGQLTLRWAGVTRSATFNSDGTVVFPGDIFVGSTPVMKVGVGGLGSVSTPIVSTVNDRTMINGLSRGNPVIGAPGAGAWAFHVGSYDGSSKWQLGFPMGSKSFRMYGRFSGPTGTPGDESSYYGTWCEMWHTKNTTVDANGFIKKASPIVKLFGNGTCELNDESQGVTTERLSDGVYRVSGTLGFNADAEWGGSDGGIEVPLDRNKQPLIWVDYEVEPTGDLLIKTYHRTHPTAPAFARNEVMGYDEGMPIDIPEGRWVDLRVEMPAVEESAPEITVGKPELES